MGKGSNVSKANKSREANLKRKEAEGKGGGGKAGIEQRVPSNMQEIMKKEQEERERKKREREEAQAKKKAEEEKEQKRLADLAAKMEAELAKKKAAGAS